MDSGMNAFGGYQERLSRISQLGELFLFFALVFFLGMTLPSAAVSLLSASHATFNFPMLAVATITRDVILVGVIYYFLRQNGEREEKIGLTFKHGWRDVVLGFFLFFAVAFAVGLLSLILQRLGFSAPSPAAMRRLMPQNSGEILLALVLVAVVAFAEETIFRGYLIQRMQSLTGSFTIAVLFSSLLFGLGHTYEGTASAIAIGCMGVVFALIYRWRGSLVVPIVMHFLQDFIALVLFPALQQH